MAKKQDDTQENRVYLFDSLASAFLEEGGEGLASSDSKERARTVRALADLAYIACAVADNGTYSSSAIRKAVLAVEGEGAQEAAAKPAKARSSAKAAKGTAKKGVVKKAVNAGATKTRTAKAGTAKGRAGSKATKATKPAKGASAAATSGDGAAAAKTPA